MKKHYEDAGVSIHEGEKTVEKIKNIVQSGQGSVSNIGAFGGLFPLDSQNIKKPVLVASIDGVGTKLKVAFLMDQHDTIGQDLVNHSINDILVQGAKPLYFMDYIGTGKLSSDVVSEIVRGVAISCKEYNCALLGGETAEMPGFYQNNEYDIAGCITGIVDQDSIITGEKISENDIVVGLPSNGLHTNGYSLARKVFFEKQGLKVDSYLEECGQTLGEELLRIHRCYLNEVMPLLSQNRIKGMAHITGGGFTGNIKRVLPKSVDCQIDTKTWNPLPVFDLISQYGAIPNTEMYEVFNMGIGYILIVSQENLKIVQDSISDSVVIGRIISGRGQVNLNL